MSQLRPGAIKSLYIDGYRFVSVAAPLVSVVFTTLKALEISVPLKDISYAWALLPILVWITVAYYRRWRYSETLSDRLEPNITLGFDPAKCIRDVPFPDGNLSRFISVTVRGREDVSIANASAYLHSVEYVDEENGSTRIDIEGSPVLEWTRSGGPVVAHNPKTLHAGREALVNVLSCTSSSYPADIYLCSPEQLIREEGAM